MKVNCPFGYKEFVRNFARIIAVVRQLDDFKFAGSERKVSLHNGNKLRTAKLAYVLGMQKLRREAQ